MTENDVTIWGIHAGRTGDADTLFLKKKCVALGWPEMGDLGMLPSTRDAFKQKAGEVYQDWKPGHIINSASQLYRFVREIKEGDIVLYPSKRDRQIHIGHIRGPYKYNPSVDTAYPNQREVSWTKFVPRTYFTQGALYEIGSALSLFQVSRYADEFLAAMKGESIAAPPAIDDTVSLVAEEIEENTKDFIIKRLAQELKGHPFAHFVGHLLNTMGYRTHVSPEGPDRGVDIVAHRDELGLEPPIIKVQVKSTEGSVGGPEVRSFYASVGTGEHALFVTLGTFSKQAISFAEGKPNLRLLENEELVNLIMDHYEQFDPRYKTQLPLRRVYIPEAPEVSEE